jgi:hypothetical protein
VAREKVLGDSWLTRAGWTLGLGFVYDVYDVTAGDTV